MAFLFPFLTFSTHSSYNCQHLFKHKSDYVTLVKTLQWLSVVQGRNSKLLSTAYLAADLCDLVSYSQHSSRTAIPAFSLFLQPLWLTCLRGVEPASASPCNTLPHNFLMCGTLSSLNGLFRCNYHRHVFSRLENLK